MTYDLTYAVFLGLKLRMRIDANSVQVVKQEEEEQEKRGEESPAELGVTSAIPEN